MSCMTSGCPRLIVVCLTLLSLHSKISALTLQTCVLKLIYPYPHFDTGKADEAFDEDEDEVHAVNAYVE